MMMRMVWLIWALMVGSGEGATHSYGTGAGAGSEMILAYPRNAENQDISGNNALGEARHLLGKRLIAEVRDGLGNPRRGIPVLFRITSEPRENLLTGSGAAVVSGPDVSSPSGSELLVLTNSLGQAAVAFRFGSAPGEYCVEATLAGDEGPPQRLVYHLTARPENWIAALVFGLIGGLSFFLFGLYYGSKGLKRLAGNRLREWLFSLTRHRFTGLLVGIVVTVIFQSSSATTALLVSFAATGLLTLGQSLGVILGADIGTTLTVQLLAFRVFDYALFFTALGFILMYTWRRIKDIGQAIFGFGLVFFSLKIVADATAPLKLDPGFPRLLESMSRAPLWGTLAAVVFTMLVRSSAATVGIAVGLAVSGLLPVRAAIPIILGANVGTAFTAWIASLRGNTEARRIALGHVLFKVIIVLPLLFLIDPLTAVVSWTASSTPRQIANAHTLINLVAALLFLPFLRPYEQLIRRLVPERADTAAGKPRYLSPALLETPAVAVSQAAREVMRMGDIVTEMLQLSLPTFLENDKDRRREIVARDDEVDSLESAIANYLTELTREESPPDVPRRAVVLFRIAGELEHIGDIISKGLMSYVKKKIDENLSFSQEGLQEIAAFHTEVVRTLQLAIAALAGWDRRLGLEAAARKELGNQRLAELHESHLARLRQGSKESLDTSTVHLDVITDLERINFHAAMIGLAISEALGSPAPRAHPERRTKEN